MVSEFDDLDALLSDAMRQADARKAAKRAAASGAKVSEEVAAIIREADVLQWQPHTAIAHLVRVDCACGATHQRFNGWYILSDHTRSAGVQRLVRADDHKGYPSMQYLTEEAVDYCPECLANCCLPVTTADDIAILDSLGDPCTCEGEQLSLEFPEEPVHDMGDELLNELEALEDENPQ